MQACAAGAEVSLVAVELEEILEQLPGGLETVEHPSRGDRILEGT